MGADMDDDIEKLCQALATPDVGDDCLSECQTNGWGHNPSFDNWYGNTCIEGYVEKYPCITTGTCTIQEDPHITVFDQGQVSLLKSSLFQARGDANAGDHWLVKS